MPITVTKIPTLTPEYTPPTAIGAACTSFDIGGLACDSKRGFIITFRGKTVGTAASYISLRVNGALTNISRHGQFSGPFPGVPQHFGDTTEYVAAPNASDGVANAEWTCTARCDDPKSGRPRTIECTSYFLYSGPSTYYSQVTWFVYLGTDEITSIGVESSVASDIHAETTYEITRI